MSAEVALARTSKLNFIRPKAYLRYKNLIDEAYERAETHDSHERVDGMDGYPKAVNGEHTKGTSERSSVHL